MTSKFLKTLYDREREVAISAVVQASIITKHLSKNLKLDQNDKAENVDGEDKKKKSTITKIDKSPVTIGDFAVQGLINLLLSKNFPNDLIVSEESSKDLISKNQDKSQNVGGGNKVEDEDGVKDIRSKVMELLNFGLNKTTLKLPEDEINWRDLRSSRLTDQDWLRVIDHGKVQVDEIGNRADEDQDRKLEDYNETLKKRFWTLDPIDGTKGFLRGQQYSICLSLVIDGKVQLGIIGTPNLPKRSILKRNRPQEEQEDGDDEEIGLIFVAERGQGSYQRSINSNDFKKISINSCNDSLNSFKLNDGKILESFESSHSNQTLSTKILKQVLNPNNEDGEDGGKDYNESFIRVDSQVKYCLIARGDGDIYLRIPTDVNYLEKIWDHAPGSIILEESGGKVTDLRGNELKFKRDLTVLKKNRSDHDEDQRGGVPIIVNEDEDKSYYTLNCFDKFNNSGILACNQNLHGSIVEIIKKSV